MESSLGLNDHYKLQRLVYVNSANHAYSEIMLDSNIAMFGDNNVGKTASLAGMKLLLYPEVDFYNCENKFTFKGKNGLFSMEESFSFYFPEYISFIVLEVENPEGIFCMVLYKRNNFGYGRFFIPVNYERLRPQFWDEQHNKFVDDISIQKVRDFVTDKGGLQLTDNAQIADLIYNGYRGDKEKQRYCLLPLRDDSKESITAFRSIYQLAYEISNLDDKTLPNAIATLLEMNRGRKQERLDADLTKLTAQHNELFSKGEWLQSLSNAEDLYKRVDGEYQHIQESIDTYSSHFTTLNSALAHAKANYADEWERVDTLFKQQRNTFQTAENDLKRLKNANREKSAVLDQRRKDHKEKRAELENAKQLRAAYGDTAEPTIISWLENDLAEAEAKLKSYQSQETLKEALQANIRKFNALKAEIEKFEGLIKDNSASIFNQLDNHSSADVLNTLNVAFASVTTPLNTVQKSAIEDFTGLFSESEGKLFFLEQPLSGLDFKPTSLSQQLEQFGAELKTKKEQLGDLNGDIEEQKQALGKDDLTGLIEKQTKDVNDIRQEKDAISGLGVLTSGEEKLRQEVDTLGAELEAEQGKYQKDLAATDEAAGVFHKTSGKRDKLIQLNNNFEQITNTLSSAKQAMQPTVELIADEKILPTLEQANALLKEANSCRDAFTQFIHSFNQLEKQLPHPEVEGHKARNYYAEYEQGIQAYKSSYATLKYEHQQYIAEVRNHNHLLTNQLNELREAKNFLLNFVAEINKELNQKPISNLAEIRLHLTLKTNFLALIDTLDKVDIQDDTLVDVSFYEALSTFVKQHFSKQKRLKMNDIIDKVTYQYKLDESEQWISKSQSGGTTTAITAAILSVLFKRLSPEHVQLQMPIIVDEISVMDTENTESTLKQIMEHGFSIFCATPTFSASLGERVGRWLMIDQATIEQPLVKHCHFNVMPEHVESFGTH